MKKELIKKSTGGLLSPWPDFRELGEIRDALSGFLDEMLGGDGHGRSLDWRGGSTWLPSVDVEESDKEYAFSLELPGLQKGDIHVEVQEGVLTIRGERKAEKEEKGRNFLRQEQHYGAFRRCFTLPRDAVAESVKASYKEGVLKVCVPRSEKAKPKAVDVSVE